MVTLNLTKQEAEWLFYAMCQKECDGWEEATTIKNKLPIFEK